jgi:hypothetical protein
MKVGLLEGERLILSFAQHKSDGKVPLIYNLQQPRIQKRMQTESFEF